MDMRMVDNPVWSGDESGAEASLVERLEAQVEALTRKVGRLERRQQRFTDMIRLLLELHDRTAARVSALDGFAPNADEEELSATVGEITRLTKTVSASARPRRTVARRKDT